MARLIKAQARKARKDHKDDSAEFIIEAMEWIRNGSLPGSKVGQFKRVTFTELRAIAQLKANNWKIKKGQVYVLQFNEYEGSLYTFKTLPLILKICLKHKIYGDD